MQINLFSEDRLSNKCDRRFSLIRNHDFVLSESISKDLLLDYALRTNDELYAKSVKYGLSNARKQDIFLGANIDSHFNLECMNVSKKSKGFVVVYSIEKLLPLILNIGSDCDVKKLIELEGIDEISSSILNLDFEKNLYIDLLQNVDEKLDEYFNRFFNEFTSETECMKGFVSNVNYLALTVLKYIMSYLETYSNMIVLSIDKSRILLSCAEPEAPSLEITYNGISYRLNPFITNEVDGFHRGSKSFNFCEVIA